MRSKLLDGRIAQWLTVARVGQPIDQAKALLFLASDLSGFLVGTRSRTGRRKPDC